MAEKRRSEAAGAVAYSKLPRLEAGPGHVLAAGVCRSSVLPGHGSDSHYNYQGTYFSYPLQCHKWPKPLAHWSPAESYASCTGGAGSQQPRPEKARCLLYRQELEGFGMWAQNSSYEKNKDCLVGETLEAQERWAQYASHTDFVQQGWIQGFPVLHATQAPTGCSPLAVPKPVYRNHVYCAEAGCSPKGPLASGRPAKSPSKRPADTEWAAPPSGHQASCGGAAPRKAPAAESGFLPFQQSWKDPAASPAGFSPYRRTFDNLQGVPSATLVDANYPGGCHNQKSIPEECARSPKAWSKLPPPGSPLAAPQAFLYPERPSACPRLPAYQLTSHEQIVLYQQSIAQAEKRNPLLAFPACKSVSFPTDEEPQLLATTYFPPAPRTYYPPPHLDSYTYRTALGSPPVTSPRLKTSREHDPHRNSPSNLAFEQRSPLLACSLAEKTLRCGSFPGQEGAQDWRAADSVAKPANESCWGPRAALQSRAFQPFHAAERLPGSFDGYGQTQETSCRAEKDHDRKERPLYVEKPSGLSRADKTRDIDIDKTPQSGACIVIPDSPVASHDPCLKGDFLRAPVPTCSDSSARCVLQSPEEGGRDLKSPEISLPPSSPPMPVIHNVFSLAPYRDYLEGSTDSVTLPSSKGCPAEKPSRDKSWASVEGKTSPRPPSAGTTGVVPDRGKETACNAAAESGREDPSGSCAVRERESRGRAGLCESYQNTHGVGQLDTTDCVRKLAKDDHALDLSLKTEGLLDVPSAQRPAGKTEVLERENGKKKGEDVKEGQEPMQNISSPVIQPSLKSASEEKSNFQSSTAFLYKKFKILKSHAAGTCSTTQQDFSLFLSSSGRAAVPNNFPMEQGCPQAATQQNSPPVQKSCLQVTTRQNSLPAPPLALEMSAQPRTRPPSSQHKCLNIKQPDPLKILPPPAPAGSPALGEVSAPLPPGCESLAKQTSPKQYFTALHTSVCTIISDSVSTSSPELLREWLGKAEPEKEPGQKAAGPAKAKNGSKSSEVPKKPSKSKEVWLAFKDVAALLKQVLSQLDTYLFMHKCPFPHVVRAGAIFIPIHVVKETLFGNLPGASVDHVLQSHKVELRPTTLSEEKLLRELELKGCSSRMLKLLALKQLPDIYPDLLDVHWHHCVKEQLGDSAEGFQNRDTDAAGAEHLEALEGTGYLGSTARLLSLGVRGRCKQGRKCELTPQGKASGSHQPESQGPSASSSKRDATLAETKALPQGVAASVALRTKHFPLRSCEKRRRFQAHQLSGALQVKLTGRVARRTRRPSKVLHLQKSVVRIKLQDAVRDRRGPPVIPGKTWKGLASLLSAKSFRRWRVGVRRSPLRPKYPQLVGKRIRHLFEEKDKSEAWYRGVVLRVHKHHKNPLKTIYEVKYDSEPEWQYYLEILQDYKKGWLEVDE